MNVIWNTNWSWIIDCMGLKMKWVDYSPTEALHKKHLLSQDSQVERGTILLTIVLLISSHHLVNEKKILFQFFHKGFGKAWLCWLQMWHFVFPNSFVASISQYDMWSLHFSHFWKWENWHRGYMSDFSSLGIPHFKCGLRHLKKNPCVNVRILDFYTAVLCASDHV